MYLTYVDSAFASLIAVVAGTLIGVISGYFGGTVPEVGAGERERGDHARSAPLHPLCRM